MGPSAEAARDPKEIAAYSVAGVGAVFLVAGLVGAVLKGSISDGWQRYPLMVGILLLAVSFVYFIFVSRQARLTTNTVIIAVWGSAILGMICYIGCFKYYRRPPLDLTSNKIHTFSEQTVKILNGLDRDINVWLLYAARDEGSKRFFGQVRDILEIARSYTPRLKVTYIDLAVAPTEKKRRAELIGEDARKLENVLVVFTDEKDKDGKPDKARIRKDIIPTGKLIDLNSLTPNRTPTPARGEQALAGGIIKVTSKRREVIYFLTGHGEKDVFGMGFQAGHMGRIRLALEREFMDVKELRLQHGRAVPDDASAVVIAGPTKPVPKKELLSLQNYMKRGGRLFILVDTDAHESFVNWLARHCLVIASRHIIYDARNTKNPQEIIAFPGLHEISLPLQGFNVVLPETRAVVPLPAANRIFKVTPILVSDRHIDLWAENDVAALKAGKIPKYSEEDGDISSIKAKGFKLGLAMEMNMSPESRKSQKVLRLVVIGDADFAENVTNYEKVGDKLIQKTYNEDLFLNAVNWLAGREEFISVRPKNPGFAALQLKGREFRVIWAVLGGIPFIVLLIGVMMYFSRRR